MPKKEQELYPEVSKKKSRSYPTQEVLKSITHPVLETFREMKRRMEGRSTRKSKRDNPLADYE